MSKIHKKQLAPTTPKDNWRRRYIKTAGAKGKQNPGAKKFFLKAIDIKGITSQPGKKLHNDNWHQRYTMTLAPKYKLVGAQRQYTPKVKKGDKGINGTKENKDKGAKDT